MNFKLCDRKVAGIGTLALGLLAFVLRLVQRAVSLGDDGLHSAKLLWPLVVLTVLAVVFALLTALSLRPRPGFAANHVPSSVSLLSLPASILLFVASAIRFFTLSGMEKWLTGCLGAVGAVCMCVITLQILQRKRPSFVIYAVMSVCLICKLIPDFRAWSVDPRISDYCFQLFAMIAMMCTTFQLSGFALDRGQRRGTVCLAILGVFFSCMSVADGGLTAVLSYLSYGMFQYATLWQLLTATKKRRKLRQPMLDAQQ